MLFTQRASKVSRGNRIQLRQLSASRWAWLKLLLSVFRWLQSRTAWSRLIAKPVDDFIITGDSMQRAWTESRLNEGLFLKRLSLVGLDDGDDKTVTILNRLVTWICFS